MKAWNADAALKRHYVSIAKKHEKAKHFTQGLYWGLADQKKTNLACWCSKKGQKHEAVAKAMGMPVELFEFAEGLFEALPEKDFPGWPRRFAEAIPVGADLRYVW